MGVLMKRLGLFEKCLGCFEIFLMGIPKRFGCFDKRLSSEVTILGPVLKHFSKRPKRIVRGPKRVVGGRENMGKRPKYFLKRPKRIVRGPKRVVRERKNMVDAAKDFSRRPLRDGWQAEWHAGTADAPAPLGLRVEERIRQQE